MKVRIDAGGRVVELECSDTPVEELGDIALHLWDQTEVVPDPNGAYGFQAARAPEPYSRYLDTQPLRVVS